MGLSSASCYLLQVNVVKEIMTLLPTGGPPVSVLEKDIKIGEALLQKISGILIPSSLVSHTPQHIHPPMLLLCILAWLGYLWLLLVLTVLLVD